LVPDTIPAARSGLETRRRTVGHHHDADGIESAHDLQLSTLVQHLFGEHARLPSVDSG